MKTENHITMMDNIKNIWRLMLPDTKKKVLQSILDSFDEVNSLLFVKQTWIYSGRIPEEHQERVLNICQKAMLEQNKMTSKALA